MKAKRTKTGRSNKQPKIHISVGNTVRTSQTSHVQANAGKVDATLQDKAKSRCPIRVLGTLVMAIATLVGALSPHLIGGRKTKELNNSPSDQRQIPKDDPVTMAQFFQEFDQSGATPVLTLTQHVGKRVTWEGYFCDVENPLQISMSLDRTSQLPAYRAYLQIQMNDCSHCGEVIR